MLIIRYTSLAVSNPHLLLSTFLPVLLFESAFAMDVHIFYKMFTQVCLSFIKFIFLCINPVKMVITNMIRNTQVAIAKILVFAEAKAFFIFIVSRFS